MILRRFMTFLLFIGLSITINAHQDRIYTFKDGNTTVDILTGFDHYLELDKADILASILSRVNRSNKRIKVNYIHSYIGKVQPVILLNRGNNSIKEGEYEFFNEKNKRAIYINVFASQLPIERILIELTEYLSIDQRLAERQDDYQIDYEYSTYNVNAINKVWISENKNYERSTEMLKFIEGQEFNPGDNYKIRKPKSFFYCDGFYYITSSYINADVVYQTDSLYQILESNDFQSSLFVFEENNKFLYLEENYDLKSLKISSCHVLPNMNDNYNPFEIISIGYKRYLIKYLQDFRSTSVYYNPQKDEIVFDIISILDQDIKKE